MNDDDQRHDERYEDGEAPPQYTDDRILIDTEELQRRLDEARAEARAEGFDAGYMRGLADAASQPIESTRLIRILVPTE